MSLKSGLQWYWDLTSAPESIVDQHNGLSLAKIGTVTVDETGGPDGGPCIDCGVFEGKYLNDSVPPLPSYDTGYSVNIWVRSTGDSGIGNWVINHRATSSPRYFQAFVRRSTELDVFSTFTADGVNSASADRESLNAWQMVTAVRRGNSVELWRNGEIIAEGEVSGDVTDTAAAPFAIGGHAWGGLSNQLDHRGQLAKAGAWNRPLTAGNIASLFNGGAGLNYGALGSAGSRRRRMMMMQRGGL